MSMLTIACPTCGFSRQLPADRVPEGARRVTCPQCKQSFSYSKPAASPAQPSPHPAAPQPAPAPPPPPVASSPAAGATPRPPGPGSTSPPPPRPAAAAPPPRPGASPPPPPRPPQRTGPTDIGELFKESWQLFQRRFAVLIGLYLLTMVAFILPIGATVGLTMLAGMAGGKPALILAGLVGTCASLYLGFRCFGGFLHAVVDERLAFGEALERGKDVILPLMWVGFLTSFIIGGGFMLLVIPGIIFTVWFFFAQFLLIKEGVHGMSALLKSRAYVSGEWFNVALRLLLIWAASVLVGVIPLVGPLLSIVFLPYVMIYHYLIYRDLAELKGDVPYSCGTSDLLIWPGIALAGFLVVPAVAVSLVGFSMFGKLASLKPGMNAGEITITQQPTNSAPGGGSGSNQDLRVITFPPPEGSQPASTVPAPGSTSPLPADNPSASVRPSAGGQDEQPDNLHVFIYAVNYSGTIRANGSVIRELGAKPDMQYNYNDTGKGLRYGQNQIEVQYAELPSHGEGLLRVHIKISRSAPGKGKEMLGDWEFTDKGSGTKTFNFNIPKP